MSTLHAFLLGEDPQRHHLRQQRQQQQQHQQRSTLRSDVLSLRMNPLQDMHLANQSNRIATTSANIASLIFVSEYAILTYKISLGFICACLCLLTVSGNLLVLITFRRIRTVGNLFILSLATADLIVGCFVMPIAGIYAIMEKWNMGLVLCQIWLSVDFTASTASIFNLLTLSLDRYWSITSPLQYLGKRTRTRALLLIGSAWGLSILWVIPIFGWHRLANNGTRLVEPDKCDPEYTHSKIFKVSTAIINFYLPLLVLICLNGRIYYEIKRRYKNVLLQRHSSHLNEPMANHRCPPIRTNSHIPITMTLCSSDRQLCSAAINYAENDTMNMATLSPPSRRARQPTLRINFKDRKGRPSMPLPIGDTERSSLQRAYSFVDRKQCAQNELAWFSRDNSRNHSRSSLSPSPTVTLRPHRAGSHHRLNVDERCYKHTHDYHSCRIYSNGRLDQPPTTDRRDSACYQETSSRRRTSSCRRCSTADGMRVTSTVATNSSATTTTTATMNVFNLCHCCSAATSAIMINSSLETCNPVRRISCSSASSSNSRKQTAVSSFNLQRSSISSSILPRSNSYLNHHRAPSNKIKQATIWNQQEKAFRQLFAIVFGFTCCFLPYFILYMVVAFCGSCVSERILTATIWLGYVNSTINPFLYALSNKHFRRTFNRILKREQRRQSYYN